MSSGCSVRTRTTGNRDRKQGNTVGTWAGSCKRDSGRGAVRHHPCPAGTAVHARPPRRPRRPLFCGRRPPWWERPPVSGPEGRKCGPQPARRTLPRPPLSRFIFRHGIYRPVNRPAPVPSFRVSLCAHAVTHGHTQPHTHTRRHVFPHNDHDTGIAACFNVCRVRNVYECESASAAAAVGAPPSARGRVASPAAWEGPAAVRGDVLQLSEREGEGSHNPRNASPSPPLKMAQEGGACHMGGVAVASRSRSAARGHAPGGRAPGRDWPARRGPRAAPRRHHFLLWAAASGRCLVTMGEIMAA